MEHYEKKISFLGENIQTIRKHRKMKQQELADKIGINMPVSYTHLENVSILGTLFRGCGSLETASTKTAKFP